MQCFKLPQAVNTLILTLLIIPNWQLFLLQNVSDYQSAHRYFSEWLAPITNFTSQFKKSEWSEKEKG